MPIIVPPPPTYAEPVIVNELTGKPQFNPIWLNWFLQFAQIVTTGSAINLVGGAAGEVVYQTAPDATGFTAAGTAGQVLLSGGATAPTWTVGALALAGDLTTLGAFASAFTMTGITALTFPVTGTLATLLGVETLKNKTINGPDNSLTNIANVSLANSSVTINGSAVSLGGSVTVTASTTAAATFDNSGTGGASGTTFNGSIAKTISYNTIGAPKADGTGASGPWGIDISGNSATVTNGVYTSGSYADPAWITSIAGSKVSGNISGNAATATSATTAGTVTTAAQPSITSLGTLTGLSVVGNSFLGGSNESAFIQSGTGFVKLIATYLSSATDVSFDLYGTTSGGVQTLSLRVKSGGKVNMPNLPTSSAGLSSGDLWNNLGILSIV